MNQPSKRAITRDDVREVLPRLLGLGGAGLACGVHVFRGDALAAALSRGGPDAQAAFLGVLLLAVAASVALAVLSRRHERRVAALLGAAATFCVTVTIIRTFRLPSPCKCSGACQPEPELVVAYVPILLAIALAARLGRDSRWSRAAGWVFVSLLVAAAWVAARDLEPAATSLRDHLRAQTFLLAAAFVTLHASHRAVTSPPREAPGARGSVHGVRR